MRRADLERYNEWWSSGKVRRELAPSYRRRPFEAALKLLSYRQAVVLTGLRRVGKSTIMYQLLERVLEDTPPSKALYYSFEDAGGSTKEVVETFEREVLKRPLDSAGKVYVFLDEVQYSSDWASAVKRYYDLYPRVKFYLSGSSSLLVSGRARDSLAGRFFSVEVYPMTFMEFVEARGIIPPGGEPSSRLEPYFHDYLGKAGFPEVAGWEEEARVVEYVRNSVIDRVLLRDIPALQGTKDPILLGRVLTALVSRPGSVVSLNELAGEFGASRLTVARYLRALEAALLLRSLGNYRPSVRSSSRKLRKYYPATTSLVRAVSEESFRADIGGALETYVVSALRASSYYRKGGAEVDVILQGGLTAVEVKASPDRRDASKLIRASRDFARRRVIVSLSDRRRLDGVEVVPAYQLEWEGLGPR